MDIRLDDMHPDVDFKRQQQLIDRADAGRMMHSAANQLIRASWPLCGCGNISAVPVDGVFYCLDCYQPAWRARRQAALQRAIDEGRAAAGGEVF